MSLTPETQTNIQKGADVTEVLGMPGWQHIYAMAMEKVLDLQSINNLDDKSPDVLIADLRARKMASTMLIDFLKSVQAFALNNDAVRKSFENDSVEDSYIQRI